MEVSHSRCVKDYSRYVCIPYSLGEISTPCMPNGYFSNPIYSAGPTGPIDRTEDTTIRGVETTNVQFTGSTAIRQLTGSIGATGSIRATGPTGPTGPSIRVDNHPDPFVRVFNGKEITIEQMDRRDRFGRTPLHVAVMGGHLSTIEFLLQNGMDTETVDNYGYRPIDITINVEIKELLIKYEPPIKEPCCD